METFAVTHHEEQQQNDRMEESPCLWHVLYNKGGFYKMPLMQHSLNLPTPQIRAMKVDPIR